MNVTTRDSNLQRMAQDPDFSGGFPPAIVESFRRALHILAAAPQESVLSQLTFLRFRRPRPRSASCRVALADDADLLFEIRNGRMKPTVVLKAIHPSRKAGR